MGTADSAEKTHTIKLLVVDDSSVVRGMLRRRFEREPDIELVASASNGRSAVEAADAHPVDIVLMDVEMPEMDGLTAIPLILEKHPHMKVIMVSTLTSRGADVTIDALRLGAVDFVCKPSSLAPGGDFDSVMNELVDKIRMFATPPPQSSALRQVAATTVGTLATPPRRAVPRYRGARPTILAIGSSTGGPQALHALLRSLPSAFDLPIVIVQHMPDIFISLLAQRLGKDTGRPAELGRQGRPVRDGTIYLAPGDHHMEVLRSAEGPVIHLNQRPPENFCRPAVDPMFRSLARTYGPNCLALVLTGMGEDGCEGARALVSAGGTVVVQDEETSVVWGMPGAVARAGLASAVLPLDDIAPYVAEACGVGVA